MVFPLLFLLFRRLPDRGFLLAKPLALLLGSYALWVLSLAHIVPNSQAGIIGIVVAIALASGYVAKRHWGEIRAFLHQQRYLLIAGEAVFLGFFFLWLTVVLSAPSINHTEKPMDFLFINAILQTTYFTPEDPWLASHSHQLLLLRAHYDSLSHEVDGHSIQHLVQPCCGPVPGLWLPPGHSRWCTTWCACREQP